MSILQLHFYQQLFGVTMFIRDMNPFLGSVFTFTTLFLLQFHLQLKHLIITTLEGNLQLNPAMLFSIGLVSTFITGGLTGYYSWR
jgi:cytochrome c oxidase subunit 1